jgi:hypothetical protein
LVTTFIPSAWADDALIAERKAGLEQYLAKLLDVPQYRQSDAVQEFLALSIPSSPPQFELEDAIPSTLSRKTAEEFISAAATFISAAYYPCKSPKESSFLVCDLPSFQLGRQTASHLRSLITPNSIFYSSVSL